MTAAPAAALHGYRNRAHTHRTDVCTHVVGTLRYLGVHALALIHFRSRRERKRFRAQTAHASEMRELNRLALLIVGGLFLSASHSVRYFFFFFLPKKMGMTMPVRCAILRHFLQQQQKLRLISYTNGMTAEIHQAGPI